MPEALAKVLASHWTRVDRQVTVPEAAQEQSAAPVLAAALALAVVPSSLHMAFSLALGQESRTSASQATHPELIHEVLTKEGPHPALRQAAADTHKADTRRQPTYGSQRKADEMAAAVGAATLSSELSSGMVEAEEEAATLNRATTMVEASLMVSRLGLVAQRNGPRHSRVGVAHCASQSTKTKRGLRGHRDYRNGRGGSHN
jgi:hypothetical protein